MKKIAFENMVRYKDEIWFFDYLNNSLCKIDSNNQIVLDVQRIGWSNTRYDDYPQYGKMVLFDGKLFIIPWSSIGVIVYDIEKRTVREINFPSKKTSRMLFLDGILVGRNLYIIPASYDGILKIDCVSETVEAIYGIDKVGDDVSAWGSICAKNGKIYFGTLFSDSINIFDVDEEKLEIIHSQELLYGCEGIFEYKGDILIVPRKRQYIYRLNETSCYMEVITEIPEEINSGEIRFHRQIVIGDEVYFTPRESRKTLMMNLPKNKYSTYEDYRQESDSETNRCMPISYLFERGGRVVASLSAGEKLVYLDTGEEYEFYGVDNCLNNQNKLYHLKSNSLPILIEKGNRVDNLRIFLCDMEYGSI